MFHVKHPKMSLPDPEMWIPADRTSLIEDYADQLTTWNTRVNLVSRSSVDMIRTQHIPHCLSIAWRRFPSGSRVVDFGTGGGLPAVPLAICFPEVQFIAIDGTGKKVAALKSMVRSLGLDNVEVLQGRAEDWDGHADYSVSRAAASLFKLWQWSSRIIARAPSGGEVTPAGSETPAGSRLFWTPGLICLKGGDISKEVRKVSKRARVQSWSLPEIVSGATDPEKYILHASAL
ncbi:16S rRNA (guanine(527)-N(7))-methyltransferase RsmG [Rhodothermus sp. AH-315-K08]|nr:16S rRNA (guanine(527)-N(7))-methyltransferase RsmG [Rhodothermus sp. AH-315-K08]